MSTIAFICIVAIVNIVIGFAIGNYLHGSSCTAHAPMAVVSSSQDQLPLSSHESDGVLVQEAPTETVSKPSIPKELLDVLEKDGIEVDSFVGASVQVLKLEVSEYRQQLVTIEQQIRNGKDSMNAETLQQLLVELKEVNENWLTKQGAAAAQLGDRSDNLGDFEQLGRELEDVLLNQAAQIETTCKNIETLDFTNNPASGCERVLREIYNLVDLAHTLHDQMHETFAAVLANENRLASLEPRSQLDGLTNLPHRVGLEAIFHQWWSADTGRQRVVSVGIMDLDQFARVNDNFGIQVGDKIIGEFGKMLMQLMRTDRGFERAVRFSGQRFAFFFGDTRPRDATSAIERIRQAIDATTFRIGKHELQLTTSCAVADIIAKETTQELFKRLNLTLRKAKKNGRNQTCLDEGNGPINLEPPDYQTSPTLIEIKDTA